MIVNNAGYGVFAAVEEASDEQIRRVIDTHLLGSINVIRAALPHLRAQGYGRILQVSTAGGQTTYPNFSYYHASKWGIEGFCETVAREIAPFGISLTIIGCGERADPQLRGRAGSLKRSDASRTKEGRRGRADPGLPLLERVAGHALLRL